MTVLANPEWNRTYDVVVIGFGGAGASAARFAADNGAKVLLTDVAPINHEGGNTRYAGQGLAANHDQEEAMKYYRSLYEGYKVPEDVLNSLTEEQAHMPEYLKKYLNVEHPIGSLDIMKANPKLPKLVPEYPGRPGDQAMDAYVVHAGTFDSALWKLLRKAVVDRSENIDIWLNSPALHLIQKPNSNTIVGVEIKRHDKNVLIKANKGVVLSLGGFENNTEMIQTFLDAPKLKPLGTLYNRGDGIKMVSEIGAKLWHMSDYEALGFSGFTVQHKDSERGHLIMTWPSVSNGSIFIAADDGGRFLREDEENKHGHLKDHNTYSIPTPQLHPHLIFDQTKYNEFKNEKVPEPGFFDLIIKGNSIEELAKKINANPKVLEQTIADFNQFTKEGRDVQFNRDPKTMRAFDDGPYYAVEIANTILNTQGGPEKNGKAQVLDYNDQPIPHLYEAGEFGGLTGRLYNGATNLAECIIFGKIAGENVAKETSLNNDADTTTGASQTDDGLGKNDILDAEKANRIELKEDQYLGSSSKGMGGTLYARVTIKDHQIKKIDFPNNTETEGIGSRAIKEMPAKIIAANSADVDVVSGASVTSRAIKDAVQNALKQVK